ncbi:MAG TPA: hypothetical protein VFO85_07575, partial [Vicinamibacteria bacterium]|nr:hypothetical protein [Vicinamibacteria bacterium]
PRRAALTLAALALPLLAAERFAARAAAATTPPPLAEMGEPLPKADTVKDPVFSILLGILDAERHGLLRGDRLDREVRQRGGSQRFLYNKIAWVSRRSLPNRSSDIQVQFWGPLKLPFPYSILGYHPGSVRSSEGCRLREWYLGDVVLGARQRAFKDVRLFTLEQGDVLVDVDGWLDLLAGDALDDATLSGLALMRYGSRRYGVAYGYNDKREARSGVLDFGQDRVLMPPPPELKGVVRDLVRRSEALKAAPQGPT